MLSHALSIFFIKLAVGLLPWLSLISIKDTGKSFFRLLIFLSGASAILSLMLHFSKECWILAVFAGVVWILYFALGRFEISRMSLSILSVFVLGGAGLFSLNPDQLEFSKGNVFLNFFSGSLLMGSALMSMILGHWYLIKPRLSFHYLKRSILIFLGLLILRMVLIVFTVFISSGSFQSLIRKTGEMLFLTRFLWGGALPLLFLFFAYQCAQVHSNRSATGILYFTTGSIFMGELMADYLTLMSGIPL
jgi:hypothetical protein